jgi:hypothetical protein
MELERPELDKAQWLWIALPARKGARFWLLLLGTRLFATVVCGLCDRARTWPYSPCTSSEPRPAVAGPCKLNVCPHDIMEPPLRLLCQALRHRPESGT